MPRKTNFTANGNDYYRATATVGKKADGSPIRKQFYGASKKEAETKRDEYMAGIKQGQSLNYDKSTFAKAFEHWLENVHNNSVGISSMVKYRIFKRLYIDNSVLAGMRLVDIKAANIQGYYNTLLNSNTANTTNEVNKLLNMFFKYCVKTDILVKNPLLAVELPKVQQKTVTNTALTDSDIEKLIKACKEDTKYFPYVFDCFTGLRSGELRALTYKDIDLSNNMINVNKSVKHLTIDGKYQAIVSDTKTAASIRRVPILTEIRPMLIEHINRIRKAHNVISINGDFLLFPSSTGSYPDPSAFLKTFRNLCGKLGIERGCTVHSLRHTFCTILARRGVSLLDASRLMGHADINITAKIYSHVTDNDKKNAVQKLAAYFN